jgi:hypothetical protein
VARRIHLAAEAQQDHSATVMLVDAVELGERRTEQPASPRRMPEPRQMRLQQIEDEPIALGESPTAVIEQKRPSCR